MQVKRKIVDDPRYDAVGSSHLREELFNTYLKAHGSDPVPDVTQTAQPEQSGEGSVEHAESEADRERKRKERKERAVKEREERIKVERGKVNADIDRSRHVIDKEEGELEFRCATYLTLVRV